MAILDAIIGVPLALAILYMVGGAIYIVGRLAWEIGKDIIVWLATKITHPGEKVPNYFAGDRDPTDGWAGF